MRIAILSFLFPPKWIAGTEIASYNIAKYLTKRGHEVHVITSRDKGLSKESKEEGFHIHRVKCLRIKYLGIPSFWLTVQPCLKRINPDIIHVQTTMLGIAGLMSKVFLRKPYVISARGGDVYHPWAFVKFSSGLVFRRSSAVIALTEHMKHEMQKIDNRVILVIPNGVSLKSFENMKATEILRGKLGLDKTVEIILFVGRLYPVKGLKYLIEAMKIISHEDSRANLVLVGGGDERRYLQKIVREFGLTECVFFIGQIPNSKIPECTLAADIFVLPSISEGFPNVILEAMAAGLPIVTTNVRGLPEIVKDGENGFVVEPQNSAQLAEKISLILSDKELRRKISANNKRRARQYSWETVVEKLEKIYLNATTVHS